MRKPGNEFKKLKKVHIWPTVLMFLLALIVGGGLLAAELAVYAAYVVENKCVQSLAEGQSISRQIDERLEAGDAPDAALLWAEETSEAPLRMAVIDSEGRILAARGEITVDLSQPVELPLLGRQEVFLDSDTTVHLKQLHGDSDSADAVGLLLRMIVTQMWQSRKSGTAAALGDMSAAVIRFGYWQAEPLEHGGGRLLTRSDIAVQRNDLVFGAIIAGVSGVMYLLIFTVLFWSAIAKAGAHHRLRRLLLLDSVTGEANWVGFVQRAAQLLAGRKDSAAAFALVDLSVLKYQGYCSLHGAKAGEEQLVRLAGLLKSALGKREAFGRVNGADFALLLNLGGAGYEQRAAERLQRLIAELSAGVPALAGRTFHAGYYLLEPGQTAARRSPDVEQYYIYAGIAKDAIAQEDEDKIACFSQSMWADQLWEHKVEESMQAALDHEEFQVYVQPKYDPGTDRLRGGEALVRWFSPTEGMIPPGRFIPIFERTGFVAKLDDYMISHVAALQSRWLAEGKEIVPISVNVSRAHFAQPDLAEHIRDLVDAWQAPHSAIEIELTESAFFDDKRALLSTVHKLQEYGFEVSMDDFGSGYSSLNSLKDLPLNVLKLDAEFFRGEDFDTRGEIVVAEAIALAKKLNMRIVAEGVEKKEQVEFLASQNCDMIQGYYYAAPMPFAEYALRLAQSGGGDPGGPAPGSNT